MFFGSSSLAAALAALATFAPGAEGLAIERVDKRQNASFHWVDTWTSMPQLVEQSNLPPSQFTSGGAVLKNATLRQTLHMSVGSPKIKITISNTFGGSDLPITAATVGLPTNGAAGVSGMQASPLAAITVGGKTSFTVPKGQVVTSDEVDFAVRPQSMITVSLYSSQGQTGSSITGHPGSRTTSWFVAGDRVNATSFASAASSVHWYFVSAVQAYVPVETGSLMVLGDSITDGRGSDDNGNNRWPDALLARLQSTNHTNVAVCNQAAGGNTVLTGGLGPPLLSRYQRDAITQPGAKWIMIFEGVNDIGGAGTSTSTQTTIGDNLIKAFTQITSDAKKAGLITIGATITPFGAPSPSQQAYSNPEREKTRIRVNKWIMSSGNFDHVVDFGAVLESTTNKGQLDSRFNGGDYLHPNVAGYKALADAFPIEIFEG